MKLAVLASGKGTNLQAVIDAIKDGTLEEASISWVVSDNPSAGAIERANRSGINVILVKKHKMTEVLRPVFEEVDLVILAGFLKIIPDELLNIKPIINIHPSLLPLFGGKGMFGVKVQEEVINSGMKVTGPTVHLVTGDIDGGPIVMQKCMEVRDDDTPSTLQERIHELEHEILIESIKRISKRKYKIMGRKVVFS